jgi:hypothetical protein
VVNRTRFLIGRRAPAARLFRWATALLVVLAGVPVPAAHAATVHGPEFRIVAEATASPVSNFSASINRLVDLVALAGSGILALVWARVALSWFSNDITKKIQAKDRARDALVGTLLFMAAVTGLFYGLAHWVLTGT